MQRMIEHQLYITGQRPKVDDNVQHYVDLDEGRVTKVERDAQNRVIVTVDFERGGSSEHFADELSRV
jgi:hypothetical protein